MIQTRSEETGIKWFETVKEAFDKAEKDKTIWKISFSMNDEQVRFVRRTNNSWVFEPIELMKV